MTKEFKKGKRGFAVKDGKLYEFNRDRVSVSKAWPPARYEKTRKKPYWHHSRVEDIPYSHFTNKYSICASKGESFLDDGFWNPPGWPPKWMPALAKFYDGIPLEVRELMLASGTNTETPWNICAFAARCIEGVEILRISPAIGFMLANLPVFRKGVRRRWDVVRRLAKRQRRDILAYLGWPDSESLARIISRIPMDACTKKNLLMLRALVRKEPKLIKCLSHIRSFSRLNIESICIGKRRERAGWRLIAELGAVTGGEEYFNMDGLFSDTLKMEEQLGLPPSEIRSIDHLRIRHDRAAMEFNRVEFAKAAEGGRFPSPPVAVPLPTQNFEIVPIDDPWKLCREGVEQSNCVSAYCDAIAKGGGKVYIYSIIKPERATLMVEKAPGRRGYSIVEIKGSFNKDVAGTTIDAIRRWLDAFSEGAVSTTLYDEFFKAVQLPALRVPHMEEIDAVQIRDPGEIVSAMAEYGIRLEDPLVRDLIGGRLFVFMIESPEDGVLLVSRDGKGGLTFSPWIEYGQLDYAGEKIIDAWIEEMERLNYPTESPGQMIFDFMQSGMAI